MRCVAYNMGGKRQETRLDGGRNGRTAVKCKIIGTPIGTSNMQINKQNLTCYNVFRTSRAGSSEPLPKRVKS